MKFQMYNFNTASTLANGTAGKWHGRLTHAASVTITGRKPYGTQ